MTDRTGKFCLTTLEYAFHGPNSLSTFCPSCGIRLVIRFDNLVNRATSIGVIIGLSALFGYHLGANQQYWKNFCRKLINFFKFNSKNDVTHLRRKSVANGSIKRKHVKVGDTDYCKPIINENVNDSDFIMSDYETFDDEFCDIIPHDRLYDDLPYINGNGSFEPYPNQCFKIDSKTVDKIDQVLHQIDDIKKSIVEIDDELYHVTGSKYACFNPDFLTLSGLDDDYDEFHNQYSSCINPFTKQSKGTFTKHRSNIGLPIHDKRMMKSSYENENKICDNQRKLSRLSYASSIENLPLEWDESECDFYSFEKPTKTNLVRIDLNSDVEMEYPSVRKKLSSSSSIVSDVNNSETLTDEQKLKTMQELLEEAKRLGLLNNIIDAFLNPSTTLTHVTAGQTSSDTEEEF